MDNLQKLLGEVDVRIANAKREEELAEMQRKIQEEKEKQQRRIESSTFALYIEKIIADILTNIRNTNGVIYGFDQKKYGDLKSNSVPKWELDDDKFQITIDFSYSIPDDAPQISFPTGFKESILDWDYACELLQEDGIKIEHVKERTVDSPPNWYSTTYFTDKLIITMERKKELKK